MKWVKRFAAGALAAALSLALLCGCSGSSKLDNVSEIDYKDSILYSRTYWCGAYSGYGWAMECRDQSTGQTYIFAEKNQNRVYLGKEQSGVVRVPYDSCLEYKVYNKNYDEVPSGVYQVNSGSDTYKKEGSLNAVEQVISDLLLSWGRDGTPGNSNPGDGRAPRKVEAASGVRNGKTYYVERAEYASGTAVVYYEMLDSMAVNARAKYLEIYLPGQKNPQARYKVNAEETFGKMVDKYGDVLRSLTEAE